MRIQLLLVCYELKCYRCMTPVLFLSVFLGSVLFISIKLKHRNILIGWASHVTIILVNLLVCKKYIQKNNVFHILASFLFVETVICYICIFLLSEMTIKVIIFCSGFVILYFYYLDFMVYLINFVDYEKLVT